MWLATASFEAKRRVVARIILTSDPAVRTAVARAWEPAAAVSLIGAPRLARQRGLSVTADALTVVQTKPTAH